MSRNYRWIVRVTSPKFYNRADYVREVETDGPWPNKALQDAVSRIAAMEGNELWQHDQLTVTVERVR